MTEIALKGDGGTEEADAKHCMQGRFILFLYKINHTDINCESRGEKNILIYLTAGNYSLKYFEVDSTESQQN